MPKRGQYWKKGGLNAETVHARSTTKGFEEFEHFDDFLYDAATAAEAIYTTTGTFGAVAGNHGQVKWVSGTTAGNQSILSLGTNAKIDPTKDFLIRARCAIGDADTELFAHIGAFETLPTAADPPVLADDYVGFELIETTADADWGAITGEDVGGAGDETTTADLGTTGALNTFHDFEIRHDADIGSIFFSIDGSQVAQHSANLPLVALRPVIMVTTGDTNAKSIIVDSWLVTNDRS